VDSMLCVGFRVLGLCMSLLEVVTYFCEMGPDQMEWSHI
jgi:hypothetical protein